ncbi:Glutamate-1-semialdehyde 2,1-aminomutase [Gossypium australe]|uniref:Glutamate-1-semialdehyde 2,1-aminomutase n=1 Tax=Gossypium australe TaxID=47621 RepID=A0A5B6VXF9_9ROSI|nr:Glutamate-1-semialdehyde 2,1-aminomutase [Gossypium australe]
MSSRFHSDRSNPRSSKLLRARDRHGSPRLRHTGVLGGRESIVRIDHGKDTQACLIAVEGTQPAHTGVPEPICKHAYGPENSFKGQMDPERAVADEVESNAPALEQGTAPSNSRPATND